MDHLTGPTSDSEDKSARFARHDLVRGAPALQDLGDDAGRKQLSFFFDETFCNPEAELLKINAAFKGRIPVKLFFDLTGFEVGVFVIERLRIKRQKTSPSGRAVRISVDVDLVESTGDTVPLAAPAGIGRATINPTLRRG